jgi:hypothetical protein
MTISAIQNFIGGVTTEGMVIPQKYRDFNYTGFVPVGVPISQNNAPFFAASIPVAEAGGLVTTQNITASGNLSLNSAETTDCVNTTLNIFGLNAANPIQARKIKVVPRTVILLGQVTKPSGLTTLTYTLTVNGFDQYFQPLTSSVTYTTPAPAGVYQLRMETPSAFAYISIVNVDVDSDAIIQAGSVVTGDSTGSRIGVPYRMISADRYTNIYYQNAVLTPISVVTPALNPSVTPVASTDDVRGLVAIPNNSGGSLLVYGWIEGASGTNGNDSAQVEILFGRIPFYSV